MKLYCEKQSRSIIPRCKKNLVVAEKGKAKIVYYRLYKNVDEPIKYKELNTDTNLINGLCTAHEDNALSDEDLSYIIKSIQNSYRELKKSNNENKTLTTLSIKYDIDYKDAVNLEYGILMEDGSIVFFYDYSDIIAGRLDLIFYEGGLL